MKHLIAVLLIALISSFAASAPVKLEEPFVLKLGASAQFGDWQLTFVRVVSDSRCPPQVDCVWAGEAEVALRVKRNSQRDTVPFKLNTFSKTSAVALGLRVTIMKLGVKPAKSATFKISQP